MDNTNNNNNNKTSIQCGWHHLLPITLNNRNGVPLRLSTKYTSAHRTILLWHFE